MPPPSSRRNSASNPQNNASGYSTIDSDDASGFNSVDSIAIADVYDNFAGVALHDNDYQLDSNIIRDEQLGPSHDISQSPQSIRRLSTGAIKTRDNLIVHGSLPHSHSDLTEPLTDHNENDEQNKDTDRSPATAKTSKIFLLLLKSFIGTGVLLLPRAFLNGGLAFSVGFLIFVSILSAYGMVLLVKSNERVPGSFGDMSRILYGKFFERLVLCSIAVSQMGFCVAYMLFVCDNAASLSISLSDNSTIKLILNSSPAIIFIQIIFYIPLALIRHLSHLSLLSLLADVFILIGLLSIVSYSLAHLYREGPSPDVIYGFNPRYFHLYIGTSIYAFEGVGLVLPLVHSIKNKNVFPRLLVGTIALTTLVYMALAISGYLAFGSNTKNVVLSNLPLDSKVSQSVQVMYVVAVMATWPLVLFPATRIIEIAVLPGRSGASSSIHKWQKNALRIFLVSFLACMAVLFSNYLDRVVAFIGSFACIPLSFIYPCMLHLRAFPNMAPIPRYIDQFMIIFGVISTAFVTYQTLFST